ncbi:MAG TPA: hypothetical protein P5530_00270 [Candidatus Diapherotrites archaeon]|nr:hypothetical protein [Candidatus Diapherotrites archaeon]
MAVNKLKKEILMDKITNQFLEQIAGPLAPEIIKMYNTDKTFSPEEIAEKLKKKITTVRSTLNSLHFRGIACYKKVRNQQNLFDFYWEIKFKKIIELVIEHESENLKKIEETIDEQEGRDYFGCPKKCMEVPFEVAAAYNFKCHYCDRPLQMLDSKTLNSALKRKKRAITKNIEKLRAIVNKIEDKTTGYICD